MVANVSALAIPETLKGWQQTFDVDMMGTVHLVQAAMPYLERSSAASIVTISSVSAGRSTSRPGLTGPSRLDDRRASSSDEPQREDFWSDVRKVVARRTFLTSDQELTR